jgi:glycosyltransferase involved in cell wall biosynthesis
LVTSAAAATRVPVRVFTLRGLRSATMTGPSKYLVRAAEAASCRMAHHVICISPSLRAEAIKFGVLPPERGVVLGAGSSNGVDIDHFQRSDDAMAAGQALRERLGVSPGALVVSFVGRVHREKGILELLEAFANLRIPDAVLLVAGPSELTPGEAEQLERQAVAGRVKLLGLIDDVRAVYAATDVVALPSWREGFGNVVIESAAMGVPVVASNVTGCCDGIVDGETGTLVPPRQPDALSRALLVYAHDPGLRRRHGEAGRRRAVSAFSNKVVWAEQLAFYNELLRGLPVRPLDLP